MKEVVEIEIKLACKLEEEFQGVYEHHDIFGLHNW